MLKKLFSKKPIDAGTVHAFAVRITQAEGKKKQVDIAQVSEILLCIQREFESVGMDFYSQVRKVNERVNANRA